MRRRCGWTGAADMEIQGVPLRTWEDFFPGLDRFSLPDVKDVPRWNNRVLSNLLYYQSNYIIVATAVFCLLGCYSPFNMIMGGLVVVCVFVVFVWASHNKNAVRKFKKRHPAMFLSSVIMCSYLLISMYGGVMIFMFGITLPILLMLIHASTRLRNMKNKLENKIEGVGLRKTPMGMVLDALEQQEEHFAKIATSFK